MSTAAEAQTQVESSPAPSQAPSEDEIRKLVSALFAAALDYGIAKETEPYSEIQRCGDYARALKDQLLTALQSQTARADRAEQALKEATTPDMYGIDDMAVESDDLYSLELDVGTVAKVWANRSLGDRWIACYYLPDSDDYEYAVFDTEAEARAALESSTPQPGATT